MSDFLQSSINSLYSTGDDFILLGLTGRTGSGCSTVASILTSDKKDIVHSLYSGHSPSSNEDRKQKIITKQFNVAWDKFTLIQVRSLITLMMALNKLPNEIDSIIEHYGVNKTTLTSIVDELTLIKTDYDLIKKFFPNSEKEDEYSFAIDFYCRTLPERCNKIRSFLKESDFLRLYQYIGKNLRTSGNAFDSNEVSGNSFSISEKINEAIKIIRKANTILRKDTLIVIDAIRNPLEALFFQERYASFYLVAVSCSDEERKNRLKKMGLTEENINLLDKQEYQLKDVDDEEAYYIQDIQGCLQKADIYINNPDEINQSSKFQMLSNQVIRFVSLMKRPGLITPTAVERCMQLAYTAKLNSGCISRQVGAAVTDINFSIRAIGWNDAPHGQVPCNLRNRFDHDKGRDITAYSKFENNNDDFRKHMKSSLVKYIDLDKKMNISYCFKSEYNKITKKENQVHTRSLHAEENAFLQIAKYGGQSLEGGYLFTTASPCELCSKKAYQIGIKTIYYIDPYPGIAIEHIIYGGSKNPEMILFTGAIGKAFHRLYMPITAYKDELNALSKKI